MSIKASTENLATVRNFATKYAAGFGFDKKAIANIRLAVDEAFTNIIKHAYKNDARQSVQIKLGLNKQEFWISLSDTGNAFDPSTYSDPDLLQIIQKSSRGGMGVFLIKELMDEVQYQTEESLNRIYMTKKK